MKVETCFEKGNRMSICKGRGKAGDFLFSCLFIFIFIFALFFVFVFWRKG